MLPYLRKLLFCFSIQNTISDIRNHPSRIQRYRFNGKHYILVRRNNNWIRFYGSVSLLLLHLSLSLCVIHLPPSSTSPEEVIHRSANQTVFSLSPASSPSVTWLKTDVGVINRRQRKPAEYRRSSSLWCLVQQHRVADNFFHPSHSSAA